MSAIPLSLWPWRTAIEHHPFPTGLTGKAYMQSIVDDVSRRHKIHSDDIRGPRRNQVIFKARAEAMWIIYDSGRFSYPQVGAFFGGRDHTSALHACRRYAEGLTEQA